MSNNRVDNIPPITTHSAGQRAPDEQVGARNSTPKAARTKDKLLHAGIDLFARQGYDATSTRQIQLAAGVQRNLITYHFGAKDAFWKACMHTLFMRVSNHVWTAVDLAGDVASLERIRFVSRRYVRAMAEHPEAPRIMFDEGRATTWRLDWLVDHHVRPLYTLIRKLYNETNLPVDSLSPIQVYYLLMSGAAIFAMAPEYQRLSRLDPFEPNLIDQQADFIAELLTTPLSTH